MFWAENQPEVAVGVFKLSRRFQCRDFVPCLILLQQSSAATMMSATDNFNSIDDNTNNN